MVCTIACIPADKADDDDAMCATCNAKSIPAPSITPPASENFDEAEGDAEVEEKVDESPVAVEEAPAVPPVVAEDEKDEEKNLDAVIDTANEASQEEFSATI